MDEDIKEENPAQRSVRLANEAVNRRRKELWWRSKARAAGMSFEDFQERYQKAREWSEKNPSYRAEYLRRYRETENGKKVLLAANHKQRDKKRGIVLAKKSGPCADCGTRFHPEAMEFDHRDSEEKSFSISSYGRAVGIPLLLAEIAKCDLVCANCHRVRTARRRAGLPATLPPPEWHI